MLRVIINADDLGKNSKVNATIEEALRRRVITSSTIMANTKCWKDVHRIVDSNPQASFGVHLNLTEGHALTENPEFLRHNIVDEDNNFTKKVRGVKSWTLELLKAVEEEWDAQIHKIKIVEGIPVTHFDGHHHIHTDFVFLPILQRMCAQYSVRNVRNRYCLPQAGIKAFITNIGELLASSSFCVAHCRNFREHSIRIISYLGSTVESAKWQEVLSKQVRLTDYFESYARMLAKTKEGMHFDADKVIELMCHPGHSDYAEEYASIARSELEQFTSCQLVSYKDI